MDRFTQMHNDYLDPDLYDKDFSDSEIEFTYETNPYRKLVWTIGSEDDFWCFDYSVSDCLRFVRLHATVNSETGGFIEDVENIVVPVKDAVKHAERLVSEALDWCDENDVTHDKKGWDQESDKFVKDLKQAAEDLK